MKQQNIRVESLTKITITTQSNECIFYLPESKLYIENFELLNSDDLVECTTMSKKEFLSNLSIECCGCVSALSNYINQELCDEGVLIGESITLHPSLVNHELLPKILSLHQSKKEQVNAILRMIYKKKPEIVKKRCLLHSMKPLPPTIWNESLADLCTEDEQYCVIDESLFQLNLQAYLKKKRFCPTCKENILSSYEALKDECQDYDCTCSILSYIQYNKATEQIQIPFDHILINTIVCKSQTQMSLYQHASTKEDAQEELLICLGNTIKDKLMNQWRTKQCQFAVKCMFLEKFAECICTKLQDAIAKKLEQLGMPNQLDQYLAQEQQQKDKLRKKRLLRKLKKRMNDVHERSGSPSNSEKNLLMSFGWSDSPSGSPQTRMELEFLKLEHYESISQRRRELRQKTKECWCEWCNNQKSIQ